MAIRRSSQGGTPFGTTANRPANPAVGQTYYNGTLGYLEIYTSAGWAAAAKGIAFGNTANRPASPDVGTPYFNGQEGRLELYTSTGWSNIVQEVPAVSTISGVYGEAAGSATITINGTNFASGAIAYVVGSNGSEYAATTTTFNSVVQLTAIFSNLSGTYEPYDVKVVNPSNLFGVIPDALYINQTPVWSTSAGTLGTFTENIAVSLSVSATDPEGTSITYSSSDIPNWLTLNSSTGSITGTPPLLSSDTTYSFTVTATDGINSSPRTFSLVVNGNPPVWSTGTTLPTFTKNVGYSTTIVASDNSGLVPTYSIISGALPTGLSINPTTGVISGTPSSSSSVTFTVRATDNNYGYADRTFTMPNAAPVWVTTSVPAYSLNVAYSTTISATDDSGITPTYSIASGTLPNGFSFDTSTGVISGTTSENNLSAKQVVFRATDLNSSSTDLTIGFAGGSATYSYTGAAQTLTAPVSGSYKLEVWGAAGGNRGTSGGNGSPGLGGYSYGNKVLTAGQTIYIYVGGAGGNAGAVGSAGAAGGFNGGGNGGDDFVGPQAAAAGGGGGSDIRVGGQALGDRVIVAGGGGGATSSYGGSSGGGSSGANGTTGSGEIAYGGTQSAGGAGGTSQYGNGTSGTLGVGGAGSTGSYGGGGGGGGGYYGGGGGNAGFEGSGGGGSGYIGGVTSAATSSGVRSGNGQAVITLL
jgi:hypothetical protein